MRPRRSVTIVSPHFDDAPLSLGQSLRDGALSRCAVRVQVVFGRTNWTRWVHPARSRAMPISWWRRAEEAVAARRFGYRWNAAGWEEAVLRWGLAGSGQLLDPDLDLSCEPLVDQVGHWLCGLARAPGRAPELLLVPAGLGGHVDHRIVALAASRVRGELTVPVGIYEDRPYLAHLEPQQVAAHLDALGAAFGGPLEALEVSRSVQRSTHRLAQRSYPSQMDEFVLAAMDADLATGARERLWFPPGGTPAWLR